MAGIAYSRGALKINGVKVAYIQNVNINHENSLLPVEQLDSPLVAEHVPLSHKVNFDCSLIKIDANAAELFGLDPDNIDDILTQPELTCELYDRLSDKVRYLITGVKFAGGNISLAVGGVLQGNWSFQGRRGKGI